MTGPAATDARVATLLEALPYIRRFAGRTVVVKYGGAAMAAADLRAAFAQDVVLLKLCGLNPVVVHGGGPEITALLDRLGVPTAWKDGLRITDAATMEVAKMVLVGKVNAELVALFAAHGARAVGLSGDDGGLVVARPAGDPELGQVGEVEAVRTELLTSLAGAGYVPVVASVALDEAGASYNLNADTVAAAIAVALRADKVVFLTDVPGLLADPADPASRVSEATADDLAALPVSGGMVPKVRACRDALAGGVGAAHILDGRQPHVLLLELFTDAGVGTKIVAGEPGH